MTIAAVMPSSSMRPASSAPICESGGAVRQNRPGLSPSRTSMLVRLTLVADGETTRACGACSGFCSSRNTASARLEVPGPTMATAPSSSTRYFAPSTAASSEVLLSTGNS